MLHCRGSRPQGKSCGFAETQEELGGAAQTANMCSPNSPTANTTPPPALPSTPSVDNNENTAWLHTADQEQPRAGGIAESCSSSLPVVATTSAMPHDEPASIENPRTSSSPASPVLDLSQLFVTEQETNVSEMPSLSVHAAPGCGTEGDPTCLFPLDAQTAKIPSSPESVSPRSSGSSESHASLPAPADDCEVEGDHYSSTSCGGSIHSASPVKVLLRIEGSTVRLLFSTATSAVCTSPFVHTHETGQDLRFISDDMLPAVSLNSDNHLLSSELMHSSEDDFVVGSTPARTPSVRLSAGSSDDNNPSNLTDFLDFQFSPIASRPSHATTSPMRATGEVSGQEVCGEAPSASTPLTLPPTSSGQYNIPPWYCETNPLTIAE